MFKKCGFTHASAEYPWQEGGHATFKDAHAHAHAVELTAVQIRHSLLTSRFYESILQPTNG